MIEIVLLATVASVIPTILYVGIIYWADQYEKEPLWLLAATFVWGALPSVLLVWWLQNEFTAPLAVIIGDQLGLAAGRTIERITTPLIEESVKALGLGILLYRHREEIDAPLDGLIYGAMVGMGFGMVENIIYFSAALLYGGMASFGASILLRGITFGLVHALFSSLVGLGMAMFKLKRNVLFKFGAPFLGWALAIFLHVLHNVTVASGGIFVMAAGLIYALSLAMTLGIIIVALWNERRWIRQHLVEEVNMGIITAKQYRLAASRRRRNFYLIDVLTHHGFGRFQRTRRFYHAVSRLAYRKHYRHMHDDFPAEIAQLRTEIRQLNADKIGSIGRLTN